ncbi:MAG TPA: C39 family peptidase [Vicinamibacterales bacterium]|nr:C39 family peptidase [Vicinamibacterales bacterium]
MFAIIAAALSVASLATPTLDVPYLPQTDALCGGAAAAMVFRYWGDAHAGVQQFASLVDRRAGGIADDVLVDAIARRGWTVERVDGSFEALDERLARGEPIIALLADRGARFHYVVVVGRGDGRFVVHDPSWGPNRALRDEEFDRRWRESGRWAVVVRPAPRRAAHDTPAEVATPASPAAIRPDDACEALTQQAIADVSARGVSAADEIFGSVRAQCPRSPAPLRELAGVRFAQRRWRDAASMARQALAFDARDAYALDVLGSSLFMLDDPVGALRAWNLIGKPTLDRVRISGLRRTRYETINEAIGLTPGALLTADAFEQARRRLDELPDRAVARLDVKPDADGFAAVDIAIAERSSVPTGVADWSAIGLGAAVDRELTATLPGFTGQGDTWAASWRWWSNRPRAALQFAAPHVGGLPGIWRVTASWEAESYSFADAALLVRETRTHADLSVADWLSPRWRYTVRGGVDAWSGGRRGTFVGGALEHRLARDRASIRGDVDAWIANAGMPDFSSATLRGQWMSPIVVSGWSFATAGGLQHVSGGAPLTMWPGAGDGHERGELLRAHPMIDDGIVNVTSATALGRTLEFGNAEAQRWIETRWPVRIGVATFADVAHAADRAFGGPLTQVDVGAGLRLRLPGVSHALRVDVAHGVRDGANALTFGWTY